MPHYLTIQVGLSETHFMRNYDTAFLNYAELFKVLDDIAEKHGMTQCGGGHDFCSNKCESLYKCEDKKKLEEVRADFVTELEKLVHERLIRFYEIIRGIGKFSVEEMWPID